jgi:ATP-dependent helicase HrpB
VKLPIFELESRLTADLRAHSRLVLQAPTGSGKSTQVPQILLDGGLAGDGEIVVLQPRRLATRMLAARVAQERGVRLGEEVGYQIRLDKVCSKQTRIRFVTEGVLLRQMLGDPELSGVAVIIFDEFHERHLYGDITLARALDLQETRRPDLKLVVMSATLDAGALQKYLAPCELLTSRGRTFPVDVEYLEKPIGDFPVWDAAAEEFERVARQTEGDVLVFMSGAYEISRTISAIRNTRAGSQCAVLPLHGELPAADQDAAVARCEQRKVIVSTNVAETSLTIDGVRVVIDAGQAKIARFDPYRGINTLLVERISRASAEQRAGRAGRTAPGRCVRLWTEREHHERPAQELPEVKRLDLAEVVLTLKASGVEDVAKFRWLEAPDPRSLERALTLLTDLGALAVSGTGVPPVIVPQASPPAVPAPAASVPDRRGRLSHSDRRDACPTAMPGAITPLGRRMLAFPAHPRYARMLLAAHELGCVPTVVQIAALTQGRGLLRRADGKQMQQERDTALGESAESDFFIHLRALRFAERCNFNPQTCRPLGIHAPAAREAAALAGQFLRIAKDEEIDTTAREIPAEAVQRCVLAGFPDMVAQRLDGATLRCALVHGRKGVLARESVVGTPLLVASEVREVEIRGDVETLLTLATAIKEEWLRELFPDGIRETTEVFFDSTLRRVLGKKQTRFHDLVLHSEQSDKVPHEQAAALLAREVEAGTCPLKLWDNTVEQWILRLNQLAEWFPEYELPKLGDDERRMLVEQICHGAVSYKDIKERPVWPVVKSWLSPLQQQLLDDQAPERIELPNGRKAKIVYAAGTAPHIATRIQDLYGVTGELRIAAHRIPLVIQVLAPNHRPIQITQNLATFWKDSYPKIKQELQRKYPRHEWR